MDIFRDGMLKAAVSRLSKSIGTLGSFGVTIKVIYNILGIPECLESVLRSVILFYHSIQRPAILPYGSRN